MQSDFTSAAVVDRLYSLSNLKSSTANSSIRMLRKNMETYIILPIYILKLGLRMEDHMCVLHVLIIVRVGS